ncbi:MAG TPA: penicillin-binding transpeptidase domain-containing protein [Polyangiaceae bacterium]
MRFSTWRVAVLPVLALGVLVPNVAHPNEAGPPAVDLRQIRIDGEGARAPIAGGGYARLTLDPDLQQAAARLLAQARPSAGAIIAIDARSGHLLAWAEQRPRRSAPSLASNALAPAASVLKIITTAALLERSHLSPDLSVCISGGLRRVDRQHLDAPRSGHATCAPFGMALGHSRNAVYAQLVTRYLLRDDLVEMAARFGFNERVPSDVHALTGKLDVPYNDLAFARTATGFRGSTLSALGAAHMASIIAGGGRAAELRIVQSAGDYRAPDEKRLLHRVIDAQTARALTRMMEVTVHSGTCRDTFSDETGRSFLPGMRVAAKTGTLQPAPHADTTSWFVGFAPSRAPQIVLSVLLSNGPVWHRKAKAVGRDVLRAYFAARGYRGVTSPSPEDTSPGDREPELLAFD